MLQTRLDNHMLPVGIAGRAVSIGIIDQLVDLDVDAADSVDERDEVIEANLDVVRNANTRELGSFANGCRRTAVIVGGVELVGAIAVDVDHGVAGDGHERCLVVDRVYAHNDIGIRARAIGIVPIVTLVRTDKQNIERLGVRCLNKLILNFLDLLIGVIALVQLLRNTVVPDGESGSAADGDDQHGAQHADGDLLALTGLAFSARVIRAVAGILARTRLIPVCVVRPAALRARGVRRSET